MPSDPPQHALHVVVLADASAITGVDASDPPDAVVLQSAPDAAACAAIAALWPEAAVVVVLDADDAAVTRLIGEGVDEVVPAATSFETITRIVHRAAIRRRRTVGAIDPAPARQPADGLPPPLEALGRLAGGVAHDFNNLLMVIGGNAERLLDALPPSESSRHDVEAIIGATRRAAELTRQLLAFGRRQTLIPAVLDLNAVIATLMPAMAEQLGTNVRVVTDLSRDLPPVRADRSQLAAVITNLASNALDAMPDGGTLTIATDTTVADNQMRTQRPWLTSGRFVRIQITDTGMGIDEQALPHLFEPFFTTTGPTRAPGLAWSSVYGIVKQSGGFIWADSRVGQGTRVTILLPPMTSEEPAPITRSDPEARPANRVLLVEDDEAVREVLVASLHRQGYVVDVAASGEEALERWSAGRFDLLVTDVVLPGIDGRQLAQQIRIMSPEAPVLFISGYTGDILNAADLDPSREFLQKPFTAAAFVERVRELLKPASRS